MSKDLLKYYEAIESASERMLEAARQGHWDHVVHMEGACAVLIAQLRFEARRCELRKEQAEKKAHIMQRILRNDAQIRDLVEPRLQELGYFLEPRNHTLH